MPDSFDIQIQNAKAAYAAFNIRDADAALARMTADVAWPRAFKGGYVHGKQAIKAYWAEQWSEIDPKVEPVSFHLESATSALVEVRQVVLDLTGSVLGDGTVGHRFTFVDGLIARMEICEWILPVTRA